MLDTTPPCVLLLVVLVVHLALAQAHSKHLLKVNTADKDGNMVIESAVYSADMTLAGLRAAADHDSPIKWSAFCRSRTAGLNLPFYSFDYEASDLEPVTKHYSADDEVQASYVFVKKDRKDFFVMPICPYSTFAQLRDRIAIRLGTSDFTFEVDSLDEERTNVRTFVKVTALRGTLPGSSLLASYNSSDEVRERTVFISSGGIGVQKAKGPHNSIYDLLMRRVDPEAEAKEAQTPHELPVVMTLNDESIVILPKVDLNNTTVGMLRDILKGKLSEKQRTLGYHQTVAVCSPYTEAELNDDDLLSRHVASKSEAVVFNVSFMSIVDWPSGSPEKQVVTVCPRSTIKQLIARTAKSYQKTKTVAQYAVMGKHLLTSIVPSKYIKQYLSQAAEGTPLHLRFVDSIFMNVQDGDGHRWVMVQDKHHRYNVDKVYESFTKLLGNTHGWSLAVCNPYDHRLGAIELPSTASLADYGLAYDGVQLDAMVIRVKVTVEAKNETVELLMNVCAKSTHANLETRIRMAVEAGDGDTLHFLTGRAGQLMSKADIDLSHYRTRPPVFPSRALYAWMGKEPFFVKDRDKVADGYLDGINVIYTLPDETVQVFNNVDPRMPVAGLRDEIGKRLSGQNLQDAAHGTLALCTRFHQPMLDSKPLIKYLGLGDNRLGIKWVTLRDWAHHGGDKLVLVTACAGETYADLINRAAPSRKEIGDAKNYQVMDGSFLTSTISRDYLADEGGLNAAKTLEIRPRDERVVHVQGSDGKFISVSVPLDAKMGDLRAKVAKVLGTGPAWGIGFCKPSSIITTLLGERGEVDENAFVFRAYGASDGCKIKSRGDRIVLLKVKGNVMRIPVTVCSGENYDELKVRMRKAVGAGEKDIMILAEDERSSLIKYLPMLNRASSKLLHMEVIMKDRDKSSSSSPSSPSSPSPSPSSPSSSLLSPSKDKLLRSLFWGVPEQPSPNKKEVYIGKIIVVVVRVVVCVIVGLVVELCRRYFGAKPEEKEPGASDTLLTAPTAPAPPSHPTHPVECASEEGKPGPMKEAEQVE